MTEQCLITIGRFESTRIWAATYLHRGIALLEKKKFAAADADFDRALELTPNFAWVQYWRHKSYETTTVRTGCDCFYCCYRA